MKIATTDQGNLLCFEDFGNVEYWCIKKYGNELWFVEHSVWNEDLDPHLLPKWIRIA